MNVFYNNLAKENKLLNLKYTVEMDDKKEKKSVNSKLSSVITYRPELTNKEVYLINKSIENVDNNVQAFREVIFF